MENLVIAFNVVLPLFLSIVLGYFLRRIGMLEEPVRLGMNKLSFKVFLPLYLFNNIYTTDIGAAFDVTLLILVMSGLFVVFLLLMTIIPIFEKDNRRRGALIQAMFRSNAALFGLPVAISLCGEANVGPTAVMIGFTVPVYNVLAVIALETFRGGKPNVKKMMKGIVTNPLIIACVLGMAFNALRIPIPAPVQESIVSLGRVATPISLVALGGQFFFSSIAAFRIQLITGVVGKLIISPFIMIAIAIMLGLRNELLVPVMILFGAPTAVSSFPMAQQMGADSDLAASLVVFTTAFSILTIFVWVFVLKQMCFI